MLTELPLRPCAVAQNIATMLVVRFLDGFAGSAFLSVAGGTVGDMFRKERLSAPMTVYAAAPFLGPELGPIAGGFINQFTNWRWSFVRICDVAAALQPRHLLTQYSMYSSFGLDYSGS